VTEGGSKGGKAIAIQEDGSKPEEIYRLFSEIKKQFGTFLASDDARWITGQVIVAAGGKRM
jgi:NAD(P)-dependent dehydrogenase (short-subunit alcohol dehydrogenase family)